MRLCFIASIHAHIELEYTYLFTGTLSYFGHLVKIFDSNLRELDSVCERIHHDEDQLYRDGLIETPKFLVIFFHSSFVVSFYVSFRVKSYV